ncbi:hypothetical protein B0H13DRAFT_1885158 [Mycena leptocephala]|nr:hypothetical protein B0H13DRAFT_1885158 [Mycena leptocephala]
MPCCIAAGPADASVPRMPRKSSDQKRKESNAHLIRPIPRLRPTHHITTPSRTSRGSAAFRWIVICGRQGPACWLYAYPGRRKVDGLVAVVALAGLLLPPDSESSTSFVTGRWRAEILGLQLKIKCTKVAEFQSSKWTYKLKERKVVVVADERGNGCTAT